MQKKVFVYLGVYVFILGGLGVRCMGNDGEVLLSYLLNNRMTIILKGTYATDAPLEWNKINSNKIFVDSDDKLSIQHQSDTACDPSMIGNCVPSYDNLALYLDFGGVRLSSQTSSLNSISDEEDSENFWNVASTERQVYCSRYPGTNSASDSCFNNGGLEKFREFMDGRGSVYPSRDIPNAHYVHTGVFVRRIVTGWASNNGELIDNAPFDNVRISGANILANVNTPPPPIDPNANDNPGPSEWFPLHHRIGSGQSLLKGTDYLPIVLEIRFNIKENLMLHSYTVTPDGGSSYQINIIAFSDWRKNHSNMMNARQSGRMGGNVLSRSRFFYPHRVSRIVVTNASSGSKRHYFALYQAAESDRNNRLPYAATPARSGSNNQLNHIMPGAYQLECRYDSNSDGYPETLSGTPVDITVPAQGKIMMTNHTCG